MMRYFQLIDDTRIPGRWYLGDVKRSRSAAYLHTCDGQTSDEEMPRVEISRRGRPLEFTMTSVDIPIIGSELATVIAEVAGADVEFQPIMVSNTLGYCLLKTRRSVDCLDESRSAYTRLSCNDYNSSRYRMVTKLFLDPVRVPEETHIFDVSGCPGALIVSELLRDAMQAAGCFGAKFVEV